MHQFQKDNLVVKVFKTRSELGAATAEDVKQKIVKVLEEKEHINIMFAAAPSQNEFLRELTQKNIEWFRINAFHMDEYVGLDKKAPQLFASFLNERLFNKVNLRSVHYINGNAKDIQEECERYAGLLNLFPTDIVCLGIGENSHLAFNDPHVANFNDNEIVKVVTLDEQSRLQQVNDGCFKYLSDVPEMAITITIPALMKASYVSCVVPGESKATAIYNTLNSELSEKYPSTILRKHNNTILYLDNLSASLIK